MIMHQRPAFWKVPNYTREHDHHTEEKPNRPSALRSPPTVNSKSSYMPRQNGHKKRVHFEDEPIEKQVQLGSPSYGEVLRGDIIAKIGEYDARDLSHADAQHLFRSAGNEIKLVVHRDSKIAYTQGISNESSRCNSTIPPSSTSPELQQLNIPNQESAPHRAPSPFLPGPGHYERALQLPVDTLPHTVFPKLNQSGGYEAPSESARFSPMPTRDHQQEVAEEQAAIVNQVYTSDDGVVDDHYDEGDVDNDRNFKIVRKWNL